MEFTALAGVGTAMGWAIPGMGSGLWPAGQGEGSRRVCHGQFLLDILGVWVVPGNAADLRALAAVVVGDHLRAVAPVCDRPDYLRALEGCVRAVAAQVPSQRVVPEWGVVPQPEHAACDLCG